MFKEYLKQYRKEITGGNPNNGICFDGVVNKEKYFAQTERLVFLLKETNGNASNGERVEVMNDWEEYMEWVQEQANGADLYRAVYRNIAMWSRMFEIYASGERAQIAEFINANGLIIDQTIHKSLEKISIVNLKKSWGVEQTNWNELKDYLGDINYKVRKEILLYQMDVLKPTIVLCGGTFDFAQMIFGVNCAVKRIETSNGSAIEYFESGDIKFVKCYHPSARFSRKKMFAHMDNILNALLRRDD